MSVHAEHLRDFFNSLGESADAEKAEALRVRALRLEQDKAIIKGSSSSTQASRIEVPRGIRTVEFKAPQVLAKEDFRREFQAGNAYNIEVISWAWRLTDKFELTGQAPDLTLAFPFGRDLGLTRAVPYGTVLEVLQSAGFTKLHPEMSLYMRRFYEQPLNEILTLVMDPIIPDGNVDPKVFALAHDRGGRWLGTAWSDPGSLWGPGGRFACGVSK